jgi:hypothetical protein
LRRFQRANAVAIARNPGQPKEYPLEAATVSIRKKSSQPLFFFCLVTAPK